ncbi:MAG: ABC transporter substrate-binding protein [Bacteroidia bacterium]|nr:ABC transporter substrate-binding protein [Bacteroidia bacterium]
MKRNFLNSAILALFAAFFIFSCGNPNQKLIENAPLITREIKDDLGRPMSFAKAPEKVISLAPSITEMIFAIGAQERLVARSQACNYPPEAENVPEIQTYPDLDLQGIVMMEPDLVLATTEIFTEDLIPYFEKFKIKIFFQDFNSTEDIYRNLNVLGDLLGHDLESQTLVDSLQKMEKQIMDSTQSQIKYGTLVLAGTDPLVVAGGKSFLNELIEKAGGKNVCADLAEKYPTVSPEAILKWDPEVLILPTRNDNDFSILVSAYPAFQGLKAVTNHQVYSIDPNLVFRPGPRTIEALGLITNMLHARINTSDLEK